MSEPVIRFKCNYSNPRGPQINERPGLIDKRERKYRRGAEHLGKGRTLRDKRRYNFKRIFRNLDI